MNLLGKPCALERGIMKTWKRKKTSKSLLCIFYIILYCNSRPSAQETSILPEIRPHNKAHGAWCLKNLDHNFFSINGKYNFPPFWIFPNEYQKQTSKAKTVKVSQPVMCEHVKIGHDRLRLSEAGNVVTGISRAHGPPDCPTKEWRGLETRGLKQKPFKSFQTVRVF